MAITRRHLLQGGAVAATVPALGLTPYLGGITPAQAQAAPDGLKWRHALATFGDIKYPAGFKRFDYVNPDAPKGGLIRQLEIGTFDNFNIVIAGLKGSIASGVGLLFESLTSQSLDEVSTAYGVLAEVAAHPDDFSYVIYRLRPNARWHDGKPVTPADVIFSFNALKTHSPMYSSYYRHITGCEQIGERDVKFIFDGPGNRELPVIAGEVTVFPKHWWEGTDSQGRKRDIAATTLEPPLGSGPYRIKEFVAGRSVLLERVPDYWGKDIPQGVGQHNFDQIRYEFFRDSTVGREAFKADQLDWIAELSAKEWSVAYDFPAVREGRVIKEKFPVLSSGRMQGWAFNLRRPLFKDARLRRAFNYAFDFEEMNRQLSTGEYTRDNSYFEGTELASRGVPEGLELQILETVRDKVPPEVFTTAYTNPVNGNPEAVRANLREATRLLKEAGFEIRDRKLVDPAGQPVSVEILNPDPGMERMTLFYKPSLERLGINVNVRTVDDVQYQNRIRSFDFDITTVVWAQSLSPGNEQREYFGSEAADRPGSRNLPGIKNPAVDALIERIIFAKNRAELVAASRAMDRVLLWNFYLVPQFLYGFQRYARWDRFSHPDPLPKYGVSGFPTVWWFDAEKSSQDRKAQLKESSMALFNRRHVLGLGVGALSAVQLGPLAYAEGGAETHGLSVFGDLKYPADFHHFDYVNPVAPKGGAFSLIPSVRAYNQSFQTFNSFNAYILKGEGAQGMDMTFASLMVRANDEPDAMYGLAAKSVRISPDKLTYRFSMRPEARFHDGSKLTAHDVAFSINTLKEKGHPLILVQLRDLVKAEALDDATVAVMFAPNRARDVPLYVAGLPIFSKAYYATRPFDESTLEAPLGSGPYKVGRYEANRYVEYDRVKDWWAADLPVCRGNFNFDTVRYEFYRDRDVAFEGFSGKSYLYREEFTARIWATRYDFPAVKDGRVKRETLPDETPSGGQGWFFNTRRDKLKDPRVREAVNYAFDFEWTNKTVMYGAYARTCSPFQNSDMVATGLPSPEELKLLEPFRGKVPDEVFGQPFVPPVSDGSGQDRALLRKAQQLLHEAGLPVKDGKRVLPNGEVFTIEFLLDEVSFQPHHATFIKNLGQLGIDAAIRMIDAVQYRARVESFDFDITTQRLSMSATPGDSLRPYFTSQAAATKGSYNLAGVANPAIDALVDKAISAETRNDLTNACRALDRVFRAGRYWVPQWYRSTHPVAYWDLFAHPPKPARYAQGTGAPDNWWADPAKAGKSEQAK